MTLGEKLSRERKALNYTQEQLADILGVSRQTISKWESDIAYPETEKLIKLGKIFECSMDYLLNDDITDKQGNGAKYSNCKSTLDKASDMFDNVTSYARKQCRKDARGFFAIGMKARGVVAIGLRARGIVSLGLLSVGLLSFGLLSIGLIALGCLSLGLVAVGSIALGLLAAGAISIGIVSFGALAIGCFASGAAAIGQYVAVGDYASAMIAVGLKNDSVIKGSVHEIVGGVSKIPSVYIREWLDGNVPWYLGWAKDIFKLYLGI